MQISDCYKVGFILKPHGLKGQVTISIDADFPSDAKQVDTIFIEINNVLVPYFIQAFSAKGDKAFVKFEDVESVETALAISKKTLYLPKSSRAKSGRGEFYDDEIVGFEVEDEAIGPLGIVREVTNAGLNKLLVLDFKEREILIPVNSPFIKSINKSKKKISLELPDGYLEI
jgi:16S rRNA processing protein RimM